MNILTAVLAVAFALLHALAALAHLRSTDRSTANDCIMLTGACAALIAAVMTLFSSGADWWIALTGLALICLTAIRNGMRKELHLRHHIIRIGVAAIQLLGFILF